MHRVLTHGAAVVALVQLFPEPLPPLTCLFLGACSGVVRWIEVLSDEDDRRRSLEVR